MIENNFNQVGGETMEKYEINENTVALFSMSNKTRIYEEDKNFVVDQSANEIMETSCSYFGSSMDGRKKGTNNLIGVTYKAPIIVEESKDLIFFPTSSPKQKNCSWLRSNKIKNYYYQNNHLVVEFKNGDKILLNISYETINNQILRATRLESVLKDRKIQK